jgi:predicted enzyme related to lactoylglutathione lyase
MEVPAMAKGEITHIEFPADDPERAKRFYTAVAGWEFSEQDGFPGYYLFRNGEASGGAVGRRGESTGKELRIYITVDSLEEACAAATASGGTIVEQPTDIGGGMGRFAVVRDTEGSEVGLWQNAEGGAG